jgi:hypothetical protein
MENVFYQKIAVKLIIKFIAQLELLFWINAQMYAAVITNTFVVTHVV